MSPDITAEVRDSTFVLSIDRPEARNAMTAEMAHAIARHIDRFDTDPQLRVAILHGRNGTFCAGMDLKRFRATGTRPIDSQRGGGGLTWQPPRKPIIAAVEGYALGLGFELVLACDLVIAAADAQFGLPEVTHGLVAAGGGAIRLPTRLPRAIAMELLLTGRLASADRLSAFGLINRVVVASEVLDEALRLAAEIGQHAPDAVRFTKELVTRSRDWPEAEAFGRQEPLVNEFLRSRLSP